MTEQQRKAFVKQDALYNVNSKKGDSEWKQVKYMYTQNDKGWSQCLLFVPPRTLFPKWLRLPVAGNQAEQGRGFHSISIYIPPQFLIHLRSEAEDPLALPLTLCSEAAEPFVSH